MASFSDRARAAGHDVPPYAQKLAEGEEKSATLIQCVACKENWPASLIDSKDDGTGNFTIFQCPICYGPDWLCI